MRAKLYRGENVAQGMDEKTPGMWEKGKGAVAFTETHEIGCTGRWVWVIVIGREKDLKHVDNETTTSTGYRLRVVLELAAAGQMHLQC